MKVFIVYPGGDATLGGGVERRFSRVFHLIRRSHQECDLRFLVTRNFKNWILENFKNENNTKVLVPPSEKNRFSYCSWCIRVIQEEKPDIVHFLNTQQRILPIISFCKFTGTKTLISIIDTMLASCKTPMRRIPYYVWIEWFFADRLDSLYPSFLQTVWGRFFAKKVTISPCSFTDYGKFVFNKGKERKKPFILFCGRMIEEKNPFWLLTTILEIKDYLRTKEWKVIMLGGGPLSDDVKFFVSRHSLEDLVDIKKTNDTVSFFKEASIFVSLQKLENYPSQSLLEAMACNCCIIATDVGSTRLLIDESSGFLINELNPDSLKDSLIFCIENPQFRNEKAQTALTRATRNQTIERYCEYTLGLWKSLKDTKNRREGERIA